MSTIVNITVAKLSVAFVAVAMLLTLAAPAQAQTTEELQQMINDLLAQVAALQSQIGQGGDSMSASGVCPYTWTRSLATGASGMDVMKLQQFLNSDADTRVAATGVGSAGQETEYFGGLTAAAVSKFQTKYRSDVLSPVGLVNPTGYFGPSSMTKANSLCSSAMADSADDAMSDDSADDSSASLSGGEASLESFNGRSGDDTDLEEGQNDAPVADFDFDVEDGDVKVSRVDVAFDPAGGNDEQDPWDTFESISIWVDGDKIAEEDADSKSDWMDDDPEDGKHTMRFTGLDWVGREGDNLQFTVGVSVQNSVDGASDGESWDVFVPVDGIRGRDGADVDQYTGDTDNTSPTEAVSFDINSEGGDDELKVQSSESDLDSTIFLADEDSRSDWTTIFAFDLDSDDSVNDITVETLVVRVFVPGDETDDVINDAQLVIDGQVFDDWTLGTANAAASDYTFDIDDELSIDAGDEVTVEFQVRFNALSGNYSEGEVIYSTTTSDSVVADGADDLSASQLSGSATGDVHAIRTLGAAALAPTVVSEVTAIEHGTTTSDDEGEFVMDFQILAFETDVYINKIAGRGTTMGTNGANYTIEGSDGTATTVGSVSASLSSDADTEGSRFIVHEKESEQFTLSVVYDPANTDFYQLQLYAINFATTNVDPTTQQQSLPASDFESDTLYVKN